MKIQIFCPARIRESYILDGEEEYLKRFPREFSIERVSGNISGSDQQREKREREFLESKTKNIQRVIVLDEQGELLSSHNFAQLISDQMNSGNPQMNFVIGGPSGIDQGLRQKATRIISLSRCTFPYQLTRLILIEQLYRAYTLIKGIAYHR